MRRRIVRWLLAVLGAVIILALVIYLISVGLDKADKLSSIISGVLAVAAVVVSLFWRRQPAAPTPEPAPEPPKPAVPAPTGRMPYLEDVDQLAPPILRDREDELAQLAAFCSDDNSSYWRWVADAWSGKTALLAWFVLHPPERADVISFFITTRFNPHGNRDAFIEAVTEQLDTLIGRRSSYDDRTPIRARHLQARLAQAAELSRQNGRHLVLVVDGLDEDRGVVIDSETYTIAALLPAGPVAGLKVIVAGRPHPPLPAEIGANHPLRKNQNIHQLTASAHALANEATARVELRRLLADPLGRQVLGLLVAAGGGLSIADLAVLTQHPRHELSQLVESSVGRTFISRPARWRHSTERYTFGLAHEELRRETLRSLDLSALTRYRESLTTWSASVAADGWPSTTPEYLLRGYLGQLIENGHLDQAVDVATDGTRRERMFAITGGDHAARLEIAELTAALVAVDPPNLSLLAQVALHREYVDGRNSRLPSQLPALWVRLGDDNRADALARGLNSDRDRQSAMQELTAALLEIGDERRLEHFVRSADDADQILRVLRRLLGNAIAAGDQARVALLTADALKWVPTATDEFELRMLTGVLASVDDTRAASVQNAIDSPYLAVSAALGRIATARARGDDVLVEVLTQEADSMLEPLQGYWLGDLLVQLHPAADDPSGPVPAAAGSEPVDREAPNSGPANGAAGTIPSSHEVDDLVAQATDLDRLWALAAAEAAGRDGLARRVESLALSMARNGHCAAAEEFLDRLDEHEIRQAVLADLAAAVAQRGDLPRARRVVARLVDDEQRLAALPDLARALWRIGDETGAHSAVEEGRQVVARIVAGPALTGHFADRAVYQSMVRLAEVCIDLGRTSDAADLANLVQRSAAGMVEHPSGDGLRALARVLAEAGEAERVVALLPGMSAENERGWLLSDLVHRLVDVGDDQLAEAVARRTADSETRLRLLVELVELRTRSGLDGRTLAAELCEPLIAPDDGTDPHEFVTRTEAVTALASGGDVDTAEELGGRIVHPVLRQRALAGVCLSAARAGRDDLAGRLFDQVVPVVQVSVLTARMSAAIGRGQRDRGDELAALALARADALDTTGTRLTAWGEVAAAAIEAGLEERADEVVDRIERTLAALVSDTGETGEWPSDGRDRARGLLVSAYLKLSRWDDAERAYRAMAVGLDRSEATWQLVRAAVEAEDPTVAERLIELLTDSAASHWDTEGLVVELARRGDYRRALELTPDDAGQHVLIPIVESAAKAGDVAFAEAVIARATRPSDQVRLWCALSRTVAEGDTETSRRLAPLWLDRAEEAADAERTVDERAAALTWIAEVSDLARGRRLVAQTLVDGPWYGSLGAMARVDPDGFQEFAGIVVELVGRRAAAGG